MENLKTVFAELKKIEWDKGITSLFIVKRTLNNKIAKYEVLHVNADDKLLMKLRKIVTDKIKFSNDVREYDFTTGDLDDDMLVLEANETDLNKVIDKIDEIEIADVKNVDQLLDSWMYIARLETDNNVLYSIRKISEFWKTKKINGLNNLIFKDSVLMDLDQKEVFKIDNKIDFFCFNGMIFIADKKCFETAMNFRVGMEKNRDVIIKELKELKIFVDVEMLKSMVGDNVRRLRKLSQVKKSGYYTNDSFLGNLKKIVEKRNWSITYDQTGKIIVDDDNIDLVLRLLNNDRLVSEINDENFDVDVKHKC